MNFILKGKAISFLRIFFFLFLWFEKWEQKVYFSCGTAGYHIGDSPDPRTIKTCKKNGVPIHHSGRKVMNWFQISRICLFVFLKKKCKEKK